MRALSRILPLLALTAFSACRTVAVNSDPRPTYSVNVQNETGVDMIVSYNDGRGDAVLGTVPANRTERFIIAASITPAVTIRGTNAAGTRTAGPISVQLVAGVPQTVRLR